MPIKKSAKKRVRVAEKRQLHNKSIRSQAKTNITKAEQLIFSGELATAREAVVTAISSLDKAAEKGVLKSNNSARRKSRLMKKLNQALASSLKITEPEQTEQAE